MHSKSNLFLIELIIAVLFFSLAAAVCIQMFALGHSINKSNEEKEHAIVSCISLAEAFEAADGDAGAAAEYFPESQMTGNVITLYFDESWLATSGNEAVYKVSLTSSEEGMFSLADIKAVTIEDESEIYSLGTRIYHQRVRGQ